MQSLKVETTKPSKDYELLDSGEGEKLERFGNIVLSRPDPQALWRKGMSEWKDVDAKYEHKAEGGEWRYKDGKLDKWAIEFGGLKFWIKPTTFKHVGLFPEQVSNWDWIREIITVPSRRQQISLRGVASRETALACGHNILNLFAYTGGATLACAQAGASVVHVDSSKSSMTWARENAELSELADKPIRWILEDARAFVKREIKRGNKYDGIIMDPPAFGHGANDEIWKIEEHFLELVEDCASLLTDHPLFFLINGYASGYSAIAYENIFKSLKEKLGGSIEIGELAIEESVRQGNSPRLLPCGIFARWSAR